jgi:hypothetical protein
LPIDKAVLEPQCGAKAEQRQRQRIRGIATVRAPDAWLSGAQRAGALTHHILAETLRQRGNRVVTNAMSRFRRINLLFKQGIGQLEALMFFGAGVEDHQRTGAETFELADVMLAKPAALV